MIGVGTEAPAGHPESAEALIHGLRGQRCFVAEDEVLIGLAMKLALEDAGMTVIGPVTSVETALSMACEADFDVALLDVSIRGGDVFPVADVVSARGLPIVFHTGHGERESLCRAYPTARLLRKPAPEEAILSELARSVGVTPKVAACTGTPMPSHPGVNTLPTQVGRSSDDAGA